MASHCMSVSPFLQQPQALGRAPNVSNQGHLLLLKSSTSFLQISGNTKRQKRSKHLHRASIQSISCVLDISVSHSIHPVSLNAAVLPQLQNACENVQRLVVDAVSGTSYSVLGPLQTIMLADLDPATAKVAIGVVGPFLSAFGFLFIARIVMSWYPKLPVGKFPYVVAYAPTEPLLSQTRKVIPPLGGVDVTPVVWFGLISFLNEILVGPQGLLILLSQQQV